VEVTAFRPVIHLSICCHEKTLQFMTALVLADIDDIHWHGDTGKADLLISCGDVDDNLIAEAVQAYGCQTILAVRGNHDRSAPFAKNMIDLHLNKVYVLDHRRDCDLISGQHRGGKTGREQGGKGFGFHAVLLPCGQIQESTFGFQSIEPRRGLDTADHHGLASKPQTTKPTTSETVAMPMGMPSTSPAPSPLLIARHAALQSAPHVAKPRNALTI
jgi:hypothetical protein